MRSRTGTSAVTAKTVLQGSSATVFLNVTVPNRGLLPLQASITCYPNQTDVSCVPANMTIGPGQVGTLHFRMTVSNYAQLEENPGGLRANGTLSFVLVPFAGISVSVNLGSMVHQGGA